MAEKKRFPFSFVSSSRNTTLTTDALLTNCYHEAQDGGVELVKRPALSLFSHVTANGVNVGVTAQGAISYNGSSFVVANDSYGTVTAKSIGGGSWTTVASPANPPTNSSSALTRVGSLASNGGVLYSLSGNGGFAGSALNYYKSTDDATSWTLVNTLASATYGVPPLWQVCAVFSGTIYFVLTGGGNTNLISTVDCTSFALVSQNFSGFISSPLYPDALLTHNGALYAFQAAQLLKTVDGGVTWTQVNAATGWGTKLRYAVYSLNGNMYVAGGTTATNDVWRSTDNGVTWTQIQASAAFSGRAAAAYWTLGSRMWIGAGSQNANPPLGTLFLSDLFYSTDGVTWTSANASFAGVAYSNMGFTVHDNTLFAGDGFRNFSGGVAHVVKVGVEALADGTTLTALSPAPSALKAPFALTNIPATSGAVTKIFLKSADKAWVWDGTTMTQITDVDYPALTVPGVVFLDGSVYVMDPFGTIFGSDLNNVTSWNALNFIAANSETDGAVALARQLQYIVAFKQWSTQFFYDAGNPTGSPLGSIPNALLEIGCAAAGSIASTDNSIFFISQSRQKGRSVSRLDGYTPTPISNPFVERLLNADPLTTVFSFIVKASGHTFYAITLVVSKLTLVFDVEAKEWGVWTALTVNAPVSVASASVRSDSSILITLSASATFSDGDPVTIAGASPSAVNGSFNLTYISSSQFSYFPATSVSGSVTGTITATLSTESYFPAVYYSYGSGSDIFLDQANGSIYSFDPGTYQDNSAPINMKVRTPLIDLGSTELKFILQTELVGDNTATTFLLRYSDDDYQTFSSYETVAMSYDRALLTCQGSMRRRTYEIRHTDNVPVRLVGLEFDIDKGAF